jgi:CheY-like chemotaxis protein
MDKTNILWADDEIELLKPHILFLEEKGYNVVTATNGQDALDLIDQQNFEIVFLDENMPGLSGLQTLEKIKNSRADLPVVMITKSEEEYIMEDAIGSQITDYLIKPVNPKQILLSLKKNLEKKRLVSEKTSSNYQQEFRNIGMILNDRLNHDQWVDVYRKLIYWELELDRSKDAGMYDILTMQKNEANLQFAKFIEQNYIDWLNDDSSAPVLSHTLFRRKILPVIESSEDPVFFFLIDNLRYDQWKVLAPVIGEFFRVKNEETYFSILPTATQYARNAVFSGMMPSDIEKRHPKLWLNDDEEGGKNMHEEEFLADQFRRLGRNIKFSYNKITNLQAGKELAENVMNLFSNEFNVVVYNFVDMLSHARTDMQVIRELAEDESAYRSITDSWFRHSPLLDAMKKVASRKCTIIITTDHGTIRVREPSRIVGDRNTNTNLRYKQGKNLKYEKKDVFEVKNPADAMLPRSNLSTSFVFAKQDLFFAYPNNFNYYVNFYRDTFQHGGISLEEMIIPYITLVNR